MPQSLAKILVHTVFSTKDSRPLLVDNVVREERTATLVEFLLIWVASPLLSEVFKTMFTCCAPYHEPAIPQRWSKRQSAAPPFGSRKGMNQSPSCERLRGKAGMDFLDWIFANSIS